MPDDFIGGLRWSPYLSSLATELYQPTLIMAYAPTLGADCDDAPWLIDELVLGLTAALSSEDDPCAARGCLAQMR